MINETMRFLTLKRNQIVETIIEIRNELEKYEDERDNFININNLYPKTYGKDFLIFIKDRIDTLKKELKEQIDLL